MKYFYFNLYCYISAISYILSLIYFTDLNKEICSELPESHGCLMSILCNTVCLNKPWKSESYWTQTGIRHTVCLLLMLHLTSVKSSLEENEDTCHEEKNKKKKKESHNFCILIISYCFMVTRKFVALFVNWINTLLFEETEYLELQFIFRSAIASGLQVQCLFGRQCTCKKVGICGVFVYFLKKKVVV